MLVLRPARLLVTYETQTGDRHAHGVDAGAGLGLAPPGAEAAVACARGATADRINIGRGKAGQACTAGWPTIHGQGALLPISFGRADGSAEYGSHTVPFDPHAPVIAALGSDGRLFIRLGGTVLPGRPQAGGTYRATISITVYNLGS